MVETRQLTLNNLNDIIKVDKEIWEDVEYDVAGIDKVYKKRLEIFPEGFIGTYKDGELVGFSTAEIIYYGPESTVISSWEQITDNGLIERTHTPDGNSLYLVSVGVSKFHRGEGFGSLLVEEQKKLTRRLNLDYMVVGGRLPGFRNYKKENPNVSAEEYVMLKVDPEVRFYEKRGLRIVKVVPEYMQGDPDSLNYGVLMVWENDQISKNE